MKNNTRKLVLLISFIIFGVSSSYAQFGFGLRLGGASTSLTGIGTNVKDFIPTPKMHFVGGGVINYSFGRRFAASAEVLYSGKGSAIQYYGENSVGRGVINMDLRLGYLAVPVILQFKMGDRDSYFHFDAGVVFNQLIHNKFTGTIDIEDDKGNVVQETFNLEDDPYLQDMGYSFGIGLVANGLMFDFAYEMGIRDVFPSSTQGLTIRNRAFRVTVGYIFRR